MPRELIHDLELAAMPLEIICDFDGTIARPDTVDELLGALADPAWREIEESWRRGEIDSRECMERQIPLLRGGWRAIERFLDARVDLHPSFARFADWCARRDVVLRIGSEGIEQVIRHLLEREHVTVTSVWASRLVRRRGARLALDFSHASGDTRCGATLCKCELLPRRSRGPVRALIGDGRSDFCAAQWADLVFARDALLEHCVAERIPCIPFQSFDSVQAVLDDILTPAARAAS